MLSMLKDKAFEVMAKNVINNKIAKYGTLTHLELDSSEKVIHAQLKLNGEDSPVSVEASDYQLEDRAGQLTLTVRRFRTSRAWLTSVLNDFAAGRPIPIPKAAGLAL